MVILECFWQKAEENIFFQLIAFWSINPWYMNQAYGVPKTKLLHLADVISNKNSRIMINYQFNDMCNREVWTSTAVHCIHSTLQMHLQSVFCLTANLAVGDNRDPIGQYTVN